MSCGTERGVKAHKGRNEPPCRFCRKFMDSPSPVVVKAKPVRAPRQQKAMRDIKYQPANTCGTEKGYQRHKRRHEPVCDPCQGAHKAKLEQGRLARAAAAPAATGPVRAQKPRKTRRPRAVCGTLAGRTRHVKQGEAVCEPCRLAYNEYARSQYRKNHPPKGPGECGTESGYGRHRWLGTTPCQPCLDAHAARTRGDYVRKTEPPPPAECGTTRGFKKHWTEGTEVCGPCRAAYNEYRREYRARRKDAA